MCPYVLPCIRSSRVDRHNLRCSFNKFISEQLPRSYPTSVSFSAFCLNFLKMFFIKILTKLGTHKMLYHSIDNANPFTCAAYCRRYFNTSERNLKQKDWKSHMFTQCQKKKKMFMDPRGKVAVITGGITGIGIAVAFELLKAGVRALVYMGPNCADKTGAVRALNAKFGKGKALYIPADAAHDRGFRNLLEHTVCRYHRIDIIFNSGGVWNDCQWENCIDTNIGGTIRGNLLALEYMSKPQKGKKACGGVVVNCASTAAFESMPTCPAYCASQHAIVGLSQCLGNPSIVQKTRLRVMSLCPDLRITEVSFKNPRHQHGLRLCLSPKEVKENRHLPSTYPVARAFLYLVKYGMTGRHYVVDGAVMSEMVYPPLAVMSRPVCRYKKRRLFGLI